MHNQFAALNEQADRMRQREAELWRKFKAALDAGEMTVMVELSETADVAVTSSEQLVDILYRA